MQILKVDGILKVESSKELRKSLCRRLEVNIRKEPIKILYFELMCARYASFLRTVHASHTLMNSPILKGSTHAQTVIVRIVRKEE